MMYDRHGHDLHSCVSSSSNALRSRSTSTGLLPLVSRPRLLSSARNSTTFNLDGSIMHARYAPLIRQANSCTPQRLTQRRKCSQKTHIHAPLTRAAYTIWRNSRKQLVCVARAVAIGWPRDRFDRRQLYDQSRPLFHPRPSAARPTIGSL